MPLPPSQPSAWPRFGHRLGELLDSSQPLLGASPGPLWGWEAGFSQHPSQPQSCSHDHPSPKHRGQRGLAEEPGKISLEYGPGARGLLPSTPKALNLSDAFYDCFIPLETILKNIYINEL